MMIRTCPKCGDYYADESLAFCLADGTPLAEVDPLGERWGEGARVVEEKGRRLRRVERRRRLRRVLTTVTTVLIMTLVVCVVVVNSYIYLRPSPDAGELVRALTPPEPTPVQLPTSTETLTPTTTTTTTTKTTKKKTEKVTITECSEAERGKEREAIIRRLGDAWRQSAEEDCRKVVAEIGRTAENRRVGDNRRAIEHGRIGVEYGGVKFDSKVTVFETCTTGAVTINYRCQAVWPLTAKVEAVGGRKTKRLVCRKVKAGWLCN